MALASSDIAAKGRLPGSFLRGLREANDALTAQGIYRHDPVLFDDADLQILAIYYRPFFVTSQGALHFMPIAPMPSFRDFSAYRDFLLREVGAVVANGRDRLRKAPMRAVVPISRGYDSPAVAALVRAQGGQTALTLDYVATDRDDCGDPIATALGFAIERFVHPLGRVVETLHVALTGTQIAMAQEFQATQGIGDDMMFVAFEPALKDAVMFCGALGDSVWSIGKPMAAGLPIVLPYNKSKTEFRLRCGFAHVPVPAIGAMNPRSIWRIALSSEMRPFRIGGPYDRPLPRRIAEQAGVPRDIFGRAKSAASPHVEIPDAVLEEAFAVVMRRYRC